MTDMLKVPGAIRARMASVDDAKSLAVWHRVNETAEVIYQLRRDREELLEACATYEAEILRLKAMLPSA